MKHGSPIETRLKSRATRSFGMIGVMVTVVLPFLSSIVSFPLPPLLSATDAQVSLLAIQIPYGNSSLTIATIYIPPTADIPTINFENFFELLPDNTIISGDFNAHSYSWSCVTPNTLGNNLDIALSNSPFILLNDDSPTHLNPTSP